jgi:DNA-binding MarR family transcriptional regulator
MPAQEWGELYAASTIAHKVASRKLAVRGLTIAQASVLGVIAENGAPLRMSEIARMLMQESQSVTTLVDRMCAKGLVDRVNGSARRRAVMVKMTDKGQRLYEVLATTTPAFTDEMFGVLSTRERATLARILQKFVEHNISRLR